MDDLLVELQAIFRRVFDQDELVITPSTSADEVDGWDSMAHINLIVAIEKKFGVRFTASDLAALSGAGQNVGTLLGLLAGKVDRGGANQT